jgi:cytochrome c biogenesis protein CcmG/thiol:disulfide interchange protein DsbE
MRADWMLCPILRSIMLIALAVTIAPATGAPGKSGLINKPAPAFARTGLDRQRVDLSALRGRVVLLNFWATWCAGCKIEMPRFVQWQDQYKAGGLSIVGVSMDDSSEPVASFLRKHPVNYPVVMGDEKLGLAYGGVLGLPVTYLIDRNGVIRARYQGISKLDAMEGDVKQLLQGP